MQGLWNKNNGKIKGNHVHRNIFNPPLMYKFASPLTMIDLYFIAIITSVNLFGFLQSGMQFDIQTLYATLLVGHSPCHQFTQVLGHTGGFYHLVCRHGVGIFV